ncbi:hypothetical protein GCM10010106_23720 [Thermopolyspora flexuosa]|uniref:Transport permease protein n=1 Tax=Thermopolyspora flexuosa TaxID=103836 RepID=A0A543IV99_9ACTN|nr:ABC transporter permease [Thermopolyspora flexuosa]TQM74490.1 ABC-2 type transport system permease protein [Thermopolyspora flexuosa]GGM76534.1 hypothetical protein GCM10010106_23720 [Thermopolyspora flexuosa]
MSPDAPIAGRRPPTRRAQFVDLLLIQLSNHRWSWRGMIVTGMAVPLVNMLALGLVGRPYGQEYLVHVLAGSIVVALLFQNQNNVAANFAYMRAMGTLDFFATLPVHRYLLVLATVIAFFLLSVPSIVVTLLAGALVLGVPVQVHPLALPVLPLCAVPLAGIGAFVGVSARTPEMAGSVTLLITIALLLIGPVVVPPALLPDWVVHTGYASPATYASSAVRQVLFGPVTGRLWLDVGALAALSCLTLWFAGRRVQWRER